MSTEPSRRELIEQAINDIIQVNGVLTVKAVAAEAGCSHTNLYRHFPDLIERIKTLKGEAEQQDAKQQLARRKGRLSKLVQQKKIKQDELIEAELALTKARSINAALQLENQQLAEKFNDKEVTYQQRLKDAHKVNQDYLNELNQAREQIALLTAELARRGTN